MTSAKEVLTIRCPDMIEIESQNDPDNYGHEISTLRFINDLTHTFDDTTPSIESSIVSDSTEGSTIHFDSNLPQQDLSYNNFCLKKSSDISIGSKTHFSGSVMIQNFIAGNEGQNSFDSNHGHGTLEETQSNVAEQISDSWFCLFRTYIPCKSKLIYISLVFVFALSVLGGVASASYLLYLHFVVPDESSSVTGAVFVCKTIEPSVCFIGSSTKSCSNLVSADGRPFISGHTTSGICEIYSIRRCQGDIQQIGTDHVSFYFEARSARC